MLKPEISLTEMYVVIPVVVAFWISELSPTTFSSTKIVLNPFNDEKLISDAEDTNT